MGKCLQCTPFMKQCFVTLGLTLNFAQYGLVTGFTSSLLPELRRNDSAILMDDAAGSMIASAPSMVMLPTNFIIPTLMGIYGRKLTSIISTLPMLAGWILVVSAHSIQAMFIARLLQGFSMGLMIILVPIAIGEYTSPKLRGAFLASLALIITASTLTAHTMGSYLVWRTRASIGAILSFINLITALYTPETASWLIDKGRYDDGKRVFRWIRGDDEEEELMKMIGANVHLRETNADASKSKTIADRINGHVQYFKATVRKPEFYKPIVIMIHLQLVLYFCGVNVYAAYSEDICKNLVGSKTDVSLMIISIDTQRFVSSACALYVIKRFRRKSILFVTVSLNVLTFLGIAGYSYAKSKSILPFDHPFIGGVLMHIYIFTVAFGGLPLPVIIGGEIFPLEFRSLASVISSLVCLPVNIVMLKTLLSLLNSIGLHGTYLLYAVFLFYSLVVCLIYLPETKDRTLQEIEDEFRGRTLTLDELEVAQSLTSANK